MANRLRQSGDPLATIIFQLCDGLQLFREPAPDQAVATPMIINEAMGRLVGDQPEFGETQRPKLSMPPMEPEVITDMMVYLCGTSGRYLTGVALPMDGGLTLK